MREEGQRRRDHPAPHQHSDSSGFGFELNASDSLNGLATPAAGGGGGVHHAQHHSLQSLKPRFTAMLYIQ